MGWDSLMPLLRRSQRALVFTGAGISTGSGIPDFRGPDGTWKRRQPVYYHEFLASESKRVEYWDYKLKGHLQFRAARPNATHRAITALQARGRVAGLVTQNIDGLHQDAGSPPESVIEIHGTNRLTECVGCGQRGDPEPAMAAFRATRSTPRCPACDGLLKLATISFGQALDPSVLARAVAAAERADLVLALGSTLSVHPAASIPLVAARAGAAYVVINRGETDHDGLATLKIDDDVAAVLPPALDALLEEVP
jgi:NAD-dependent deacetylase